MALVACAGLQAQSKDLVRAQFVGCDSDGQSGPLVAPKSPRGNVMVRRDVARSLVYYEAENGPGVLGPRGWHCFGAYGSNGFVLVVSPDPVSFQLWMDRSQLRRSAVEVSQRFGGTSGRFDVAATIARLFPNYRDFVRRVADDGSGASLKDFPVGKFPDDILTYRGKSVVEFRTPAGTTGLGTASFLDPDGGAIDGVAIIGGPVEEPNVVRAAIRLPAELAGMSRVVIEQLEQQAARGRQ
jgi:hypothetical protein